jgi:AbrB family looped-hinge helix DNA binding protein
MSKVTSKLQLTVPKTIADQFGIRPGDNLEWFPAGEVIRVVPSRAHKPPDSLSLEERLDLFDRATLRQRQREAAARRNGGQASQQRPRSRGWKREDLYRRGLTG